MIAGGYLYFGVEDPPHNFGEIERISVTGGEAHGFFIGEDGIRGLAVSGPDLYWISAGEHAIGRIPTNDFTGGTCIFSIPSCDHEYATGLQGSLFGLAADGAGHLLWSSNGEAPPNPGNDLYRYEAGVAEPLTDLTPDPNPGEENGAEVQGFLGASTDGSYLYFVANGDLDGAGPAQTGDCKRDPHNVTQVSGGCNLYLWHSGQSELISRLQMHGNEGLLWSLAGGTGTTPSPKTSFTSADGKTLLFRSASQLTDYDNAGTLELYRYRVGEGITCASCDPTGRTPKRRFPRAPSPAPTPGSKQSQPGRSRQRNLQLPPGPKRRLRRRLGPLHRRRHRPALSAPQPDRAPERTGPRRLRRRRPLR